MCNPAAHRKKPMDILTFGAGTFSFFFFNSRRLLGAGPFTRTFLSTFIHFSVNWLEDDTSLSTPVFLFKENEDKEEVCQGLSKEKNICLQSFQSRPPYNLFCHDHQAYKSCLSFPVKGRRSSDLYDGFSWQSDPFHIVRAVNEFTQDRLIVLRSSRLYWADGTSVPVEVILNIQSSSAALPGQRFFEIIHHSSESSPEKISRKVLVWRPRSHQECRRTFPPLILY